MDSFDSFLSIGKRGEDKNLSSSPRNRAAQIMGIKCFRPPSRYHTRLVGSGENKNWRPVVLVWWSETGRHTGQRQAGSGTDLLETDLETTTCNYSAATKMLHRTKVSHKEYSEVRGPRLGEIFTLYRNSSLAVKAQIRFVAQRINRLGCSAKINLKHWSNNL